VPNYGGGAPMGAESSPGRKRRRAAARKRQEDRWAAMASAVKVTQAELCTVEDCDGSCGKWHRL